MKQRLLQSLIAVALIPLAGGPAACGQPADCSTEICSFEEVLNAVSRGSEDETVLNQFAYYASDPEHASEVLRTVESKVAREPAAKWTATYYLALMNAGKCKKASEVAVSLGSALGADCDGAGREYASALGCALELQALANLYDFSGQGSRDEVRSGFDKCIELADRIPSDYMIPEVARKFPLVGDVHLGVELRFRLAMWLYLDGRRREAGIVMADAVEYCSSHHSIATCQRTEGQCLSMLASALSFTEEANDDLVQPPSMDPPPDEQGRLDEWREKTGEVGQGDADQRF